jgi:uncharacterized protein (DUF2249 family)
MRRLAVTTRTAHLTEPTGASAARVSTVVTVASGADDAAAVDAVVRHHGELAASLAARVEALSDAVGDLASSGASPFETARERLVTFCTGELLPHAAAEEGTLYPAAAGDERATLLVEAMMAEHRVLENLVAGVSTATRPIRAAATATALRVLFEVHLAKENDLILPLVAADPTLSLTEILAGMRELLGPQDNPQAGGDGSAAPACGGACACGSDDSGASPVLDVRTVPHSIRHATVFGAAEAVPAGGSLVLLAPHDPRPLLAQLEEREPGAFTIGYEVQGPGTWQLRLTRRG